MNNYNSLPLLRSRSLLVFIVVMISCKKEESNTPVFAPATPIGQQERSLSLEATFSAGFSYQKEYFPNPPTGQVLGFYFGSGKSDKSTIGPSQTYFCFYESIYGQKEYTYNSSLIRFYPGLFKKINSDQIKSLSAVIIDEEEDMIFLRISRPAKPEKSFDDNVLLLNAEAMIDGGTGKYSTAIGTTNVHAEMRMDRGYVTLSYNGTIRFR